MSVSTTADATAATFCARCGVQDELPALAKSATEVEFKPGQSIIKQGEEGNEFFMIKPLIFMIFMCDANLYKLMLLVTSGLLHAAPVAPRKGTADVEINGKKVLLR